MVELPSEAQVVVIGGGVVGCSVAYHLTRRGWSDVVLLERDRLTSGTTWHSAGLVTQLRGSYNMTKLAKYTADLFRELEETTGHETGLVMTGSLTLATTAERMTEISRGASTARLFDIDAEILSPEDAKRAWPMMDADGVVGAVRLEGDGFANPTDVTQALAAGARSGGAQVIEGIRVLSVGQEDGRVSAVTTDAGTISTQLVVNCSGMWARELGARSGVTIPLHASEHFYLVTEPIENLPQPLPILRCLDEWAYVKGETGKLLVGFFEPDGKPWASEGIPDDASFTRLPEDWPHITPYLDMVAKRVPVLRDVGIQLHFNGPESFTPDDRYILGEAPELQGYHVAAGFNSVGFLSSGGAGRVLADWIVDGHPPMDLWDVDIRRFARLQGNRRYLRDRTAEVLGLLYDDHWPFRQVETSRPVRRTPIHHRLEERGAGWGELAGWERANWYGMPGVTPTYDYSWGRQNWFDASAAEHRAVRERAGIFDQSSFGKILVQGRDARSVLDRVSTASMDVVAGTIVYTQWLNERAGIESDLTVSRIAEDAYLVVTATSSIGRDLDWLQRHIPSDALATATDVTSQFAVLSVMGPDARDILAPLTDADLSSAAFPFATTREIDLGYAFVRASRITYVGELGWELYIPADVAVHVYDTIVESAAAAGLRHCGYHALDSLRIEKAYRHWGHDITDEDTSLEAGLTFTHAWDKPGGFIGREALLRQQAKGISRRLAAFVLQDGEPLLYHLEPILRDGERVGHITSGWYGHSLGAAVGLGYVSDPTGGAVTADFVRSGRYEIEIAGQRHEATAHLRAPYDPDNTRIRS